MSDSEPETHDALDVTVSGGSMAGLFAGVGLDRAGHDPTVYERSTGDLESRGAGIVAQSAVRRFLDRHGIVDPERIVTIVDRREYLARDGSVDASRPESMAFTAWDAVYRNLRSAFPDDRYREGREVTGVRPDPEAPAVEFADGSTVRPDLAAVAEGGRSATREQLLPDVAPEFADYVAWRGVVREREVPGAIRDQFEAAFTFYQGPDLLILGYLIPGPDGGTDPGDRRLNWVWYDAVGDDPSRSALLTDADGVERTVTVPPGAVREPIERRQRTRADDALPDVFSRVVAATDRPFVQAIYDLSVPQMAFDRTALLGDAAFAARPHTAAGTAKAAADAAALADSLRANDGVQTALREWEATRLDAGRRLVERGREMGERRLGLG
ncbi:FAD binding domain-containing protein [Halorussus sp. AFM4]|uniref:FAD binding domain-containing protein n=1 Tax=Halorussus sp. AFM4 TaxID=3421651 RepID=UPI003EB91122